MDVQNASRWPGLCAGGYFAAAAVYVGNAIALATVRTGALLLVLLMAVLPVICVAMGGLVLAGNHWAPKWSVVVAAGFTAIHLVGLAYLFLAAPVSVPVLTRSLQWQLGSAFVSLWLLILCFAFRLARSLEVPPIGSSRSPFAVDAGAPSVKDVTYPKSPK